MGAFLFSRFILHFTTGDTKAIHIFRQKFRGAKLLPENPYRGWRVNRITTGDTKVIHIQPLSGLARQSHYHRWNVAIHILPLQGIVRGKIEMRPTLIERIVSSLVG
jgi:hypothetical protein